MASKEQLLVDTMSFRVTVLEESKNGPGKYIARGEFARSDRATENRRFYPRELWGREIARMNEQLKGNKVFGELDHPMDGRTQLRRVSHLVTDLHLEGNVVVGTAHILDTDAGRNLKAILDAEGAVGVSSRGFGTTKPNMKGEDVVQDDYRLMTFDFVAEPAMSSAYPKISNEHKDPEKGSVEEAMAVMDKDITLEELKESNPDLAKSFMHDAEREYELRGAEIWAKKIAAAKQEASSDLRGEFAEKLESAIKEVSKEIEATVREKLMNDPTVGGAKKALGEMKTLLRPFIIPEDVESVVSERDSVIDSLHKKITETELRLANLSEENEKLASIAREAGYRFHLEQRLNGIEHADLVRELVGDVKRYESVAEMDEQIASILEEVEKQSQRDEVRDEEVVRLQEEVARYRMVGEKALEASKALAAQVYLEKRLANHPDAETVRALAESKDPSSKEEIDQLIESVRKRPSMTEDIEVARARVRNLLNSETREYIQEEQENPVNRTDTNYNGLGIDSQALRALAGIDDNSPSN